MKKKIMHSFKNIIPKLNEKSLKNDVAYHKKKDLVLLENEQNQDVPSLSLEQDHGQEQQHQQQAAVVCHHCCLSKGKNADDSWSNQSSTQKNKDKVCKQNGLAQNHAKKNMACFYADAVRR